MKTAEKDELARLQSNLGTLARKLHVATDECERYLDKALEGPLSAADEGGREKATREARAIRVEMDAVSKSIADVRSGAWMREQTRLADMPEVRGKLATLRGEVPTLRAEIAMLDGKLATLKRIEAAGGQPLRGVQLRDRQQYTRRRSAAVSKLKRTEKRVKTLLHKVHA